MKNVGKREKLVVCLCKCRQAHNTNRVLGLETLSLVIHDSVIIVKSICVYELQRGSRWKEIGQRSRPLLCLI